MKGIFLPLNKFFSVEFLLDIRTITPNHRNFSVARFKMIKIQNESNNTIIYNKNCTLMEQKKEGSITKNLNSI